MDGVAIQYFLGIYFLVTSIERVDNKLVADLIRLVAGLVLFILAVIGISFI